MQNFKSALQINAVLLSMCSNGPAVGASAERRIVFINMPTSERLTTGLFSISRHAFCKSFAVPGLAEPHSA
jgi:hypothetical protein